MTYPLRTGALHGLLFILSSVCFVLPVIAGTGALLSVPIAAGLSALLAVLMLIDSSYHAFSPAQRTTRGLRMVSALAAVALIAGWVLWLMIYNTFDKPMGTEYRLGTFLLTVGTVLTAFGAAIALTHHRARDAGR